MNWFAVDITALPGVADATAAALDAIGAEGTAIDTLRRKPGEPVLISGYFADPVSLEDCEDSIGTEFQAHGIDRKGILNIDLHPVENTDWLAEWKKHWKPTEAGRFVVAAPWSELTSDKITIRIEPNMAFGTGTHETTRLCLMAISELYQPPMTVLDVGTGTGILAIAAAKLGASEIVACDTDHDSVKIAIENADMNGAGDSIDFFEGPIGPNTAAADLVCANLTLDVILPILGTLVNKTRKNLLLSGILAEQEPEIRRALYEFQIADPSFAYSGEWISVVITVS